MSKSEWISEEYTQNLIKYIKDEVNHLQTSWANGNFTTEDSQGTLQMNSKAIGACQAFDLILEIILDRENGNNYGVEGTGSQNIIKSNY